MDTHCNHFDGHFQWKKSKNKIIENLKPEKYISKNIDKLAEIVNQDTLVEIFYSRASEKGLILKIVNS